MTEKIYTTGVDGLRTIKTAQEFNADDYVHIYDAIYSNEHCLFKFKSISKNDEIDFRPVKVVDGLEVSEEKVEKYNVNQLVEVNLNDKQYTLFFEIRPSKKQIIAIDKVFYEIEDVEKRKGQPNVLILNKLEVKEVSTVHAILRNGKDLPKEEVYEYKNSWADAFGAVGEYRSRRDGYYYRLR